MAMIVMDACSGTPWIGPGYVQPAAEKAEMRFASDPVLVRALQAYDLSTGIKNERVQSFFTPMMEPFANCLYHGTDLKAFRQMLLGAFAEPGGREDALWEEYAARVDDARHKALVAGTPPWGCRCGDGRRRARLH